VKLAIGELLNPDQEFRKILYDVRFPTKEALYATYPETTYLPSRYRNAFATTIPVRRMILICKRIPWRIEVENPSGITYGDVLEHLYVNLQSDMGYAEWWISDDKKRKKVMEEVTKEATGKTRRDPSRGLSPKKVDWLSEHTWLQGIGKDEKLMDERAVPKKEREDTWTVVLTRPPERE
jgi:hypothetical protein